MDLFAKLDENASTKGPNITLPSIVPTEIPEINDILPDRAERNRQSREKPNESPQKETPEVSVRKRHNDVLAENLATVTRHFD